MIELRYKIDLAKDNRSLEALNIKRLTKGEASNFVLFLEQVKLNILDREFELGDNGFEINEENEDGG